MLDKSQRTEHYTSATFFSHVGIPVLIDAQHAIARSKYMILGTDRLITGSFNFTKAAEGQNSENLLVIHDRALAATYLQNWRTHAQHATPYAP
jgi:phosphatidylserine/phosphatidylglycerophosphate/cardiolipin synthase-like enzyme